MKIVFVGKYYYPHIGGMEKSLQILAEELVIKGHEVHVLVANDEKKFALENINGVQVHRLKLYGRLLNLPLVCWSKKLIEKINPDIVNVHLPNPLALWKLRNLRFKTVYTIHTTTLSNSWINIIHFKFQNLIINSKNGVIVTSQHLKFLLASQKIQPQVIPLGLPGRFKNLLGIEKKFDLVFVGRIVNYKGLEYLIRALVLCKRSLLIIGDGPEKNKLRAMSRSLKIDKQITWAGSLRGADLEKGIESARVMVLPSISPAEAFGLCLLEGMSKGLALITTKIESGVQEVNVDGQTGLSVPPRDSLALAKAIQIILSDGDLLQSYSKKSRSRFERFYSSNKMAESFIHYLEKSVKTGPK